MIINNFSFPLTQKENIPSAIQKTTAQDKMHGAAKINFFFNLNNCCQTTFFLAIAQLHPEPYKPR